MKMKKVFLAFAIMFAMVLPAQAQPTPAVVSNEEHLATLFAWRDSVNRRLEKIEQGGKGSNNDALIAELRGQIAALNTQLFQMQQMQMMQLGKPIPLNPNPGPVIPLNPNPGPVIPLNPNPGPVIPLNPNPGPVIPFNPNPGPAIPLLPNPGTPIPIPIPPAPKSIPGPGPGPVNGFQRFTSDRPPIITGTHSYDRPPVITIYRETK
jgi:hypothetical protein